MTDRVFVVNLFQTYDEYADELLDLLIAAELDGDTEGAARYRAELEEIGEFEPQEEGD